MKKMIFAIVILLVIIGLGTYEQIFVANTLEEFNKKIDALEVAVITDNNPEGEAEAMEKWWIDNKHYLEALSPHNFFMDVTYSVYEVKGNLENKEIPQALTRIEILRGQVKNLDHILGLHWEHIV